MSSSPSLSKIVLEYQLRRDQENQIHLIRDQLRHTYDPALMSLADRMAKATPREVADILGDTECTNLRHELSVLREIDLALQRLRNGTYGICAKCGRAIEPMRLSELPATRCCLQCKNAFETRRGIVRNPVI